MPGGRRRESDDITSNFHGGNRQSEDANRVVTPHKSVQRGAIYRLIMQYSPHGIHCEAIERVLNLKHQSAAARISELKADGMIGIVGYTKTTSGARAACYVVVPDLPQPEVER